MKIFYGYVTLLRRIQLVYDIIYLRRYKEDLLMALNITKENFAKVIESSDTPVLIDFWAPWCGPCKMLGPIIEELSKDYKDKAIVGKVNVDEAQDIAQEYGIMSIPAVMVFKGGKVVDSSVGVKPKAYYVKALDSAL